MSWMRGFLFQRSGSFSAPSVERGQKKAPVGFRLPGHKSGNDLLSREIPVSSAFESLTTVFGMGTGVTSQVESPENRGPTLFDGHSVLWCEK